MKNRFSYNWGKSRECENIDERIELRKIDERRTQRDDATKEKMKPTLVRAQKRIVVLC
jgi:hypothetical protein